MTDTVTLLDYKIPCFEIEMMSKLTDDPIPSKKPYNIGVEAWELLQMFVKQHQEEDCIFIVQDKSKVFSEEDQSLLLDTIIASASKDAKMLFANAGQVGQMLPLDGNLLWIDQASISSCIVLFKPLFTEIISYKVDDFKSFWYDVNLLTSQKLIMFPFVDPEAVMDEDEYLTFESNVRRLQSVQSRFSVV